MAHSLGTHVLLDLWGFAPGLLDDAGLLEERLVQAAHEGGAHVVETRFRRFEPQGISGVVILAESHIALHSWPEHGYLAVDVFTCGTPGVAERVSDALIASLCPHHYEIRRLQRGMILDPSNQAAATQPAVQAAGRWERENG